MQVRNMESVKGNSVANQFILTGLGAGTFHNGDERLGSGNAFQSYQSIIVFKEYTGRTFLDRDKWDYSRTTGKYRNLFLNETIKETQAKIDSGEYQLTDLN